MVDVLGIDYAVCDSHANGDSYSTGTPGEWTADMTRGAIVTRLMHAGAISVGSNVIESYFGSPFQFVQVKVRQSTNPGGGWAHGAIRVDAWDW